MKALISCGEHSGDLYAGRMVEALQTRWNNPMEWFGMGGSACRSAGVQTLVDADNLQSHGIIEALPQVSRLYKAFKKMVREIDHRRPDWALLVDFPDFHLRLAGELHRRGIPVVQFIAPTVWAWRPSRVRRMQRYIDKLLVVYPFEEPLFKDLSIDAEYVGHPLLDIIRVDKNRSEFLQQYGWKEPVRVIGLMPGSRPREVQTLLPAMAEAIPQIRPKTGEPKFFLVPSPTVDPQGFRSILESSGPSEIPWIEPNDKYNAMANADILVAASGSATLEALLTRTPVVVLYKLHPLTWWIAKRMVKVRYASMINIMAHEEVVPELLQGAVQPERIAASVHAILDDPVHLKSILSRYLDLIDDLGCAHAFSAGPDAIEPLLDQRGLLG